MKMRMLTLVSVMLFGFTAFAADANGTWTGKMCCGESGSYPVTLTMKVDGDKVSGTLAQAKGQGREIANGSIKGDEVSFVLPYAREGQTSGINYTAKIEGNELTLTEQREGRKGKHGTLTRQ